MFVIFNYLFYYEKMIKLQVSNSKYIMKEK